MPKPARTRLFTMRLSTVESERLERVAKKYGLTKANLLRMLFKKEEDRISANSS